MRETLTIRTAPAEAFATIGQLMITVYSDLEGFPKQDEQPEYYELLAKVGEFTSKPGVEILIAESASGELLGAVVYFGDMQHYGSEGTATQEKNTAGFRLLAVAPQARGMGVGKALTLACLEKARQQGLGQMIIHSTEYMRTAWGMYERMGFQRSPDLDFTQKDLPVYGFRLNLN